MYVQFRHPRTYCGIVIPQYQDLVSKVKRRDAACVTGPPGSQISKGKRQNKEEKEEEKQNLRQIKTRKTN